MACFKIPFPLRLVLLLIGFLPSPYALGQCTYEQVLHVSGTEHVGCVDVTATSTETPVIAASQCGYEPFWVGVYGSASFTFTFSAPVGGVKINIMAVDNAFGNFEEMSVDVNGAFYPITNPGLPDGCQTPATLFPPGVVRATTGTIGSWRDIIINEPMNSITVANNWVNGVANGFAISLDICCINCPTDAGEITANALELCTDELASVPPPQQTFLESDDLLQYILFSDPVDTLGSILITNNSPGFSFDPAILSTGVTYYIAAIAGNDLNGNVDLSGFCLDISNAIEVVWHPLPTVSFFSAATDVCADNCYDIALTFTGTPPFQLKGEVRAGVNVIETIDETYNSNNAIYTICLPSNTPNGALVIETTELEDGHCGCD